ncbi:AAEL000607-PA [Aedes aegypti]|uniref:AAEL000607-PA n=1 Tax=Aedes aegypti TaxID=7159 RepID=Q17NQ7_AEDAE|nr:AAEL000607-PA [Aedes aegypti]
MRFHQLKSFLILNRGMLHVWLLMSLFGFALLEITEDRIIYYNPKDKDGVTTMVYSNIFTAPLKCPPGFGLDMFNRCRKLIF